jgi:hypothetical protein
VEIVDYLGPVGGLLTLGGGIVAAVLTRRSQSVKDVSTTIDTFIRVTNLEMTRLKKRVSFLEEFIRKNDLPVPHSDPAFDRNKKNEQ